MRQVRVRLCALAEIAADGAVALDVPEAALELVVVTVAGEHYAYENRCPHRGTSLDWVPGRVLSSDGQHLQCATHGARFELHSGQCVAGPCAGDRLTPLRVRAEQGALWLMPG